ncbi:delta(24(24))-sterol reductase [Pyrenophora seminiperda CCB06]|uniref:Delta(24(24))-sterol reductase n=1 Tax=Pyrenophora seminiperda CCB06 TaxID=1302712 RepID=A0A3M7MCS2_9PLEO|nr:delta(24(24))-sterol reductase [Pyrenophora seminiperda CCB06]
MGAKLHPQGLCIDSVGGQYVYNEAATKATCEAYKNRNKGGEQWNQCPDCKMTVISNLPLCQSEGWHIGGDELEFYCKKNGAWGSMA